MIFNKLAERMIQWLNHMDSHFFHAAGLFIRDTTQITLLVKPEVNTMFYTLTEVTRLQANVVVSAC